MNWRNSTERFGVIASTLHWIIVLGLIAQYFLAEAGEGHEEAAGAFDAMRLHQSIGWTILGLAVVRVAWRFADPRPQWPAAMRPFEIALAMTAHTMFYALLFAIPLSGWALASAEGDPLEGDPLRFFGLFSLPALPAGADMKETIEEVHEVLFNVLVALAVLHVIAALKHQFIDRDGLLKSMLPGRG